MNDHDALPFDMRQRPGRRGTPPTLDDETTDRLLAGRLDPADAPPGYAAVAKLVAAAVAAATTEELAGEPEAVAGFAATARPGLRTRASTTRRAGVPRRLLTVKAAAAVLVAALSIGGVAAAAGVFPAPAQPAADHGPDNRGRDAAATTGRGAAATTTTADGTTTDRERGNGTATGPDATGPAKDGLCRAWEAGQGGQHGKREDSPAFRALAAAAGGADKIAAYCQTTTPGGSAGHGQDQGQGKGKGQGQDPPPSGGPGHGNGGPPPTD
jgi:hypothetical protein